MQRRALVFEDDEGVQEVLSILLQQRGYEVFAFSHPGLCPLHAKNHCPCPEGAACAHLIISDLNMPVVKGLDFIEELQRKECRCPSFAVMSGDVSGADLQRADQLGCFLINKPFSLDTFRGWLNSVEQSLIASQALADQSVIQSAPTQPR